MFLFHWKKNSVLQPSTGRESNNIGNKISQPILWRVNVSYFLFTFIYLKNVGCVFQIDRGLSAQRCKHTHVWCLGLLHVSGRLPGNFQRFFHDGCRHWRRHCPYILSVQSAFRNDGSWMHGVVEEENCTHCGCCCSLNATSTSLSSPSCTASRCLRRRSSSSCHGAPSCWPKPADSLVSHRRTETVFGGSGVHALLYLSPSIHFFVKLLLFESVFLFLLKLFSITRHPQFDLIHCAWSSASTSQAQNILIYTNQAWLGFNGS